jgi:hypothetical protein
LSLSGVHFLYYLEDYFEADDDDDDDDGGGGQFLVGSDSPNIL